MSRCANVYVRDNDVDGPQYRNAEDASVKSGFASLRAELAEMKQQMKQDLDRLTESTELAAMREEVSRLHESTEKILAVVASPTYRSTQSQSGGKVAKSKSASKKTSAPPDPSETGPLLLSKATSTAKQFNQKAVSNSLAHGAHMVEHEDAVIQHQSSHLAVVPTEEENKVMLQRIFLDTEAEEARRVQRRELRKNKVRWLLDFWRHHTTSQLEKMIDIGMGFVICVNAVFIGISMDHGTKEAAWIFFDSIFTAIFLAELSFRVYLRGFLGHFCGSAWFSNIFDCGLILVDLLQFCIASFSSGESVASMPSASLFRVLRLIKLARLLRVITLDMFEDVLAMIQGLIGGFRTLMWAVVLFLLVVYVIALLFREFFGRQEVENVYDFFDSVPRAMFTTFRCSFGDCSAASGVPIFEYVQEAYGGFYSLFYCLFVFGVTIGIFNVISAIFVESTMTVASRMQHDKRKNRLSDRNLWNSRITGLIRELVEISQHHEVSGNLSESVDDIYDIEMQSHVIDEMIKFTHVRKMLDDLDIDPNDHQYLSELLDPDNGGTIGIVDFIDGLRRLRGEPRRSDVVSINMMIRSLQVLASDMQQQIDDIHKVMFKRSS